MVPALWEPRVMLTGGVVTSWSPPPGSSVGLVSGSHLHKKLWGFGGGGDTFHLQKLVEEGACECGPEEWIWL